MVLFAKIFIRDISSDLYEIFLPKNVYDASDVRCQWLNPDAFPGSNPRAFVVELSGIRRERMN